jgi:hypothetical protein
MLASAYLTYYYGLISEAYSSVSNKRAEDPYTAISNDW